MNEPMIEATGYLNLESTEVPFAFSIAFQPIVDIRARRVYAYEALVRGPRDEPAAETLGQVTDANRDAFDQSCRATAIAMAARLGLAETGALLSINFMPGTVYTPGACMQLTLECAERCGFPLEQLIFEITEDEELHNRAQLCENVKEYRRSGLRIALDDFGAGHSGLTLLAAIPTDIIKLDKELIRNLHERPSALTIVRYTVDLCHALGSEVVAEGVECFEEYAVLCQSGVHLMQGYLFAKPAFEALGEVHWPAPIVVT